MKIETETGRRPHPAPLLPLTAFHYRRLFVEDDAVHIASRARLPIEADMYASLAEGLNSAALEYFRQARRDRAGTSSDLEEWTSRLAKASSAFLHALGLDTKEPPLSCPLRAYIALCGRDDVSTLTDRLYSEDFDYMQALNRAAAGALVVHDLASHASAYYKGKKVNSKKAAVKKDLSPRQVLILYLARVFQDCLGARAPKFPEASKSPFLRFAKKSCNLIAARMVPPAEQFTEPNDGSDYEAAQALRYASESQIANDLRKIHPHIDEPKRAPWEPGKVIKVTDE